MFGWLGYKGFWTLDIDYRSTYYMAWFPMPHSCIGIQPAETGKRLRHGDRRVGINHIALWARSRVEVDRFHREFLTPRAVPVTDPPREYAQYTPGYYTVFFDDPINGIHWELTRLPTIPSPAGLWRSYRTLRRVASAHPEWKHSVAREAMRTLPGRDTS